MVRQRTEMLRPVRRMWKRERRWHLGHGSELEVSWYDSKSLPSSWSSMLELFVHSEELFSFIWFSMLNCFSQRNDRERKRRCRSQTSVEQSLKNDESENHRNSVDAGCVAYAGASEDQTKLRIHAGNLPKAAVWFGLSPEGYSSPQSNR